MRADKRELFYFSCSDQFQIKTFPLQEPRPGEEVKVNRDLEERCQNGVYFEGVRDFEFVSSVLVHQGRKKMSKYALVYFILPFGR